MPERPAPPAPEFDAYAADYAALMEESIKSSGESPEYFGEYKLACLRRFGAPVGEPILDFGCGVGSVTRLLARDYQDVTGYEPSTKSLGIAREKVQGARWASDESELADGHFATAVCSGVLHHIPRDERRGVLTRLRGKLRPGGRLFVFEHNPLNPLTRRAVATCPFDEDAVLLWPWELGSLLESAGFEIARRDYIVFFPSVLAKLRPLEPYLRHIALGAQVMAIATRPA
jgi:SAM-dependent methyltransferase